MINEAIRLNAEGEYTPLAIETSGHAALKENYFLDDGAYLVTRLLIAMAQAAKQGKNLTDRIADLQMPLEATEIRLRFKDGVDFKTLGKQIISEFTAHGENAYYATPAKDNYEGFRLCYDTYHGDGWALMRMSLHEPILPINVESDSANGVVKILKDLYYFLRGYDGLDTQPLANAIQAWRQQTIVLTNKKFAAAGKAKLKNF